ncbi:AIPR protein [Chitinophaga dinghuensis]|uniref:AIPR protein n=1 Tax=Chitinophaga dinghuensis TaxID=1539050 RepID=A0A327VU00_9BACT|nr:AIPR family protein [Chitinophaga dinghuensis]RAJ78952.1 AIPR protein [Chitinophaga dinghuensis]
MAKNDAIIIDSIIDDRVALNNPSDKRDEVFEYFSIEQILKDYALAPSDIHEGMVDGQNDGGIDAFYIFINGHHLSDLENFYWPKSNVEIEVFIITCKHHDTFKQASLDSMIATLSELMDFTIDKKDLRGDYNKELLMKREILKTAYRRVASKISKFCFKIMYASRGDTSILGESVKSRSNQIEELILSCFADSNANFIFWGSAELIEANRKKPNFSLELPFVEYLGRGERYVLLCKLTDYYNFITDDDKKLRRYLFDSNVRDFMGLNAVNEEIKSTLENTNSPDFWWLNNGITILATSGKVIGDLIQMEDIQIVNGLQTTESIYNHFYSGGEDPNMRSVLIKVLVSKDNEVRDSIIHATNNQTSVSVPALHATDKIQRDIEDVLLTRGLYYERRTHYYFNQNISKNLIVSPLYLGAAYVALIKKQPHSASQLKSKFMRKPEQYAEVFSQDLNISIWPILAKIIKKSDEVLELNRSFGKTGTDGYLKRWRHLLAIITVARRFGTFAFTINQILTLDKNEINEQEFSDTYDFLKTHPIDTSSRWKNKVIYDGILMASKDHFNLEGIQVLKLNVPKLKDYKETGYLPVSIQESLIHEIDAALPPQPWPPGILKQISIELKISSRIVSNVVNILISRGLRNRQQKGIVYDKEGRIIAIDKNRNMMAQNSLEKLSSHSEQVNSNKTTSNEV